MNQTTLYLENFPRKMSGALAVALLFCRKTFYKESSVIGEYEKGFFGGVKDKLNTLLSGRTIVTIIAGMIVALSFLLIYIFYTKN